MTLSEQLFRIYIAKVYPVLAHNDPVYQQSLAKAGLGRPASNEVAPAHRESFEQEMKLQASLAAAHIHDAHSLEQGTMRAKVLVGPTTFYRVAQSGCAVAPGIWWFSDKVAQRCRDESGPDPKERLNWLRNVLAVCYNWSRFDLIQRLSLHPGESIPAVLGRGLAMPYYSGTPYLDRKTGQRRIDIPLDYWEKKGLILQGGELQIVLPWVPVRRIASTESL